MKTVVTYQSAGGRGRINLCRECAERRDAANSWPRDAHGNEICRVYHGEHRGECQGWCRQEAHVAAAAAQVHEWDRAAAPGSETPLLGPALDNLRSAETPEAIDEALDWWRLAYEAVDTWPHPVTSEELLELGVDSDAALSRARARSAAAHLAEVRSDLGLTLDQLSARIDVDRSTIHRWETGASLPQHPGMLRLAMERLAQSGR